MNEIVVKNLTKDYGFGRGVFDVSFSIQKGEVFGFLGPNGSGKSTTIRHLMGFSKPDSGNAQILGLDSFNNYSKFMENVGYLPGEIALPNGLTGYEFIDMMKNLKKVKDDSWTNYLIKLFELDPSGDTKRMSLGIKRKLAIVTAFMNDPDILILDEPTSGLDLKMQNTFINFIKSEKKRGKTILLSSHIFSEVDAVCDRIAIIKDGKVVSEFIANDLKHKQDKLFKIAFETKSEKEQFIKDSKDLKSYEIKDSEDCSLLIFINDTKINSLLPILSKYKIVSFEHIKETLEDYFMKYYKEDKDFGGALWQKI